MASEIRKLKVVVHAVAPTVGISEAQDAPDTRQSDTFHGHAEGKRAESDGQGIDRSAQSKVDYCFPHALGVNEVVVSR